MPGKAVMGKRPTSRDVAARAGVSQSTVSQVFTGRAGISAATRERVLEAAREIDYRPNLAARSMRTTRTGRLAAVLPITAFHSAPLIAGTIERARAAGYDVEVQSIPNAPDQRRPRLLEMIDSRQFEGILCYAPVPGDDLVRVDPNVPVLTLAEFDDDMRVSGEMLDVHPLESMVERLAELGHRRFLHITGARSYPSADARRRAYEATVARLGVQSVGVVEGDWSAQSGLDAIRSLDEGSLPLAVIAANDFIATGVIRGALERGWTVPGDVSVTGWDDSPTSAFQTPSLTSVSMDYVELGRRTADRLIALMRGEQPPSATGPLQHVIWRESTAAPSS
ncbi:LacI family DNA-binding transcriptional regulator [Microbacterium arborescens]